MQLRHPFPRRRGVTIVESAVVVPVALFLILGLIVGGAGIYRYLQVASLAREASRWASVRGTDYTQETNQPAATNQTIHDQVVAAGAFGLDPNRLQTQVTWDQSNAPRRVINSQGEARINTVTVTVTYDWFPEVFLVGPYTLRSTSTFPMSY